MGKIKTLSEMKKIVKDLKKDGKKIIFTNGCFDIIHAGHIKILKKAKSLGDILIVGLNKDKSVRKLKGKNRPIMKEKHRAEILASFEMVDFVVPFGEETPEKLIKEIKPDVLVKGADYKNKKVVGKEIVEKYGGKVFLCPLVKNCSTSLIIKKIKENF